MTKEQLRALYEEKNEFLKGADGSITISRKNFWKFFSLTYEAAHCEGVKNGRALEKMEGERFAHLNKVETSLEKFFRKPPKS
jgi:hypothetical protein